MSTTIVVQLLFFEQISLAFELLQFLLDFGPQGLGLHGTRGLHL